MKRISGFEEMSPWRYPFYILFHPIDGFQELKANKKGSMKCAIIIVLAWLLVEVFHRSFTSYDMNPYGMESQEMFRVSIMTVLMYVLACLSNWCFCTLLDGKGRLKDICVVGAYSLLPYVIVRLVTVMLSWVLVTDEQVMLTYALVLSEIWCALMIIVGLGEIHEYTLKKVFLSIFLTIVGIIIMLFLSLVVIMLLQQLYFFVATVSFELKY